MKTEVPLCMRCCFCMPLRYGLLVWGYLVLLPNTLLLISDCFEFNYLAQILQYYNAFELCRFLGAFFAKICNYALTLLLIIASHKKNTRLLNIYYTYGLVATGLNAVLMITSTVFDLVSYWDYFFIWRILPFRIACYVIFIGLQLYIIALVRSEIFKLENGSKFEFRNVAAEAECGYYGPNDGRTTQDNSQTGPQVAISKEVTENTDATTKKANNEDKVSDIVKTKNKVNLLNSALSVVVNRNSGYDTVVNEE